MRKIYIGVIRWDVWVGELNPVGLEVERCLSKKEYQNRLPFYTTFDGNAIKIRCDKDEIVKQEINYASDNGIDYFAFCWYPFNSGLDYARNTFFKIKQSKIKWCLIIGTNSFNENDALWLVEQFKSDKYQKIDGKPLVYIFNINDKLLRIVNFIKKKCDISPYFVGLVWNKKQAIEMNNLFNLDAISQYCTPGENNLDYNILSQQEIMSWNDYSCINKVVPWVTTGWDKRPRYDNPVSWEKCDNFNTQYVKFPTIKQLQKELDLAYEFGKKQKSRTILIYAWNEFDEGGFIAPTLNEDKSINVSKLKAIKEIIEKNKK